MEFEGMRMVPILELGPSQLYLDQSKIEAVETWFHPEDMAATLGRYIILGMDDTLSRTGTAVVMPPIKQAFHAYRLYTTRRISCPGK